MKQLTPQEEARNLLKTSDAEWLEQTLAFYSQAEDPARVYEIWRAEMIGRGFSEDVAAEIVRMVAALVSARRTLH